MSYDVGQFAEKYMLALESALASTPQAGLCGLELEWNMLDAQFQPLHSASSGGKTLSFVDFLRQECLSPHIFPSSQLEVFHWMIEWATRPYYSPRLAVYEGRFLEASLINAMAFAGRRLEQSLYYWHGNLLDLPQVGHETIPGSWNLAKRRYLERCVDLYGASLATAGTHANLSLPDPLLAWDFMHLPPTERGDLHFDEYKSEFYITGTRLMRAFAALFIAAGASTPLAAQPRAGATAIVLTDDDSVRNLIFPNPTSLDLPNLYRSYGDYLNSSYDLVRRGVRFGNNNWTPARARSLAEPVERLIAVTSEQLQALYSRGLYMNGGGQPVDEMAHQIEVQNLLARINLPMIRVEVRTDDGGQPLEIDIANLTLKHLLILRFYADPEFGRAFRYDREDLARARRNEEAAARRGLRAEIENPFSGKPVEMRPFLSWTLAEVRPLAEALELWGDLQPLVEMSAGAPNTSEQLRSRLRRELSGEIQVPVEVLQGLVKEREEAVRQDIQGIIDRLSGLGSESGKLGEVLHSAREMARQDARAPIRLLDRPERIISTAYADKTSEIIDLASHLIAIPSVTACPEERLEEVRRAGAFIFDYLRGHGLEVRYYDRQKYPAVLAGFPGKLAAPLMLCGHFDVVSPEPDESQFEPRIEGDYLWGRGAADMKTVVATYLVWLKDRMGHSDPHPPINLLLIGNEENGEIEPMGSPHLLRLLQDGEIDGRPYRPELFIAGERTGEKGDELWGEICPENRGVMRFEVIARGQRGHSGVAAAGADLSERLIAARADLQLILKQRLTLSSPDGWQSQARFPFIQVGTPGVYNVTPDRAVLGVEVRPIPQDDLPGLHTALMAYCAEHDLECQVSVMEPGVVCDPDNPYLLALIEAVRAASGQEPRLGRKLPGTSARFAPRRQGVVWGQTGLAPHGKGERHFIPSILPYYQALERLAEELRGFKNLHGFHKND
jgi:succinyl-diaminopimelate desuccinylase